MSNLIPVNPKSLKTNSDEMVTSLDDAIRVGEIVAKSKMFPEVTDQAKAVVAILAGRELGIAPMASLRGIHVIKGKVEVGAGLLAAMIKASDKYNYVVSKHDEQECILIWRENIGGAWTTVGDSKFTMADAKRAKLVKPDSNWEKFPRAMLFARALTEGQKLYCPNIGIGAIYAPGEIAETDDVIEIESEPQPSKLHKIAADGAVYDRIGDLLTGASAEDSPEARRYYLAWLQQGAFQAFGQLVKKPTEEIFTEFGHLAEGRKMFGQVATYDATTAPTNEEAEAPATPYNPAEAVMTEREERLKDRLMAQREKHIPSPDPVPLKVTLTPAQQKVSDAVMAAIREHKKDRATVLHLIGQYLQRLDIKRSSDLSDEESEKVYIYLQTLGSQWSAEAECEQAIANDEV